MEPRAHTLIFIRELLLQFSKSIRRSAPNRVCVSPPPRLLPPSSHSSVTAVMTYIHRASSQSLPHSCQSTVAFSFPSGQKVLMSFL